MVQGCWAKKTPAAAAAAAHSVAWPIGCAPMGATRVRYSRGFMLCEGTSLSNRTAVNPTAEQNIMCQSVSAIGKGKPLYASSHCGMGGKETQGQHGTSAAATARDN